MGLLQSAVETYDAMSHLVGVEIEGKETLAPIGFITTNAKIKITIANNGDFVQAEQFDKKIIIPATEESSGRTSSPSPHPLCDQIAYVSDVDSQKHSLYMEILKEWISFDGDNLKLKAILSYVEKSSVISDLSKADLIKYGDSGQIKNEKDIICWEVIGVGEKSGPVWTDSDIIRSYTDFYLNKNEDKNKEICQITGENASLASQHIKGIVPINGNAKLISSNDTANFTYRGRFTDDSQALTVSYVASQKAHNALKWLVSTQSVSFSNRVFICWNPKGHELPKIISPFIFEREEPIEPTAYKHELEKILLGYSSKIPEEEKVIIAAFDAATTGRLSVSYYNELQCSDFLERLKYWDETCCWFNRFGASSPTLKKIVECSYGIQRVSNENAKLETDEKLMKIQMQRLIACRIDKVRIPLDIVKTIVNRAGNLQILNSKNRQTLLFTVCAVIKKYKMDYYKEECSMALEPNKKNRDYQYGRLLAILERMEAATYERGYERETNAIRMQSVFVQRPAYAARIIIEKLNSGYKAKLSSGARIYFESLIGEVMSVISEFEEDYNKPLNETYLLGYYLQRNTFFTKNEKTNDNMEETENE